VQQAHGALVVLVAVLPAACHAPASSELPHVRFEPTPPEIVAAMLDLARVTPDDIVYDLGSGDGRIVIAAARRGARAVGIEIDPALVEQARTAAAAAGLGDRARFERQDLFEANIERATVVTLYLLPEVNVALRPKLLRDLAPGTRIVSHSHDMDDWAPEKTLVIADGEGKRHVIHLWTVPPRKDQRPSG
jgi:protein-L-isoaspartate O-methyltransferase